MGRSKTMLHLGKGNCCEKIADWVNKVCNHLYWCATSTKEGFQEMMTAKWKSFMEHVANKHDNHPSSLFKKCANEDIDNQWYIRIGTVIRHVKKSINPLYQQCTPKNNLKKKDIENSDMNFQLMVMLFLFL